MARDVHDPSQLEAFNNTLEFTMPDKEIRYEFDSEVRFLFLVITFKINLRTISTPVVHLYSNLLPVLFL